MPQRTDIYKFITHRNEEVTWDHELINMQTVENQLYGSYLFFGSGIVNGWDVLDVEQNEIDELPEDVKSSWEHSDANMIVKVTPGDGVIVPYAAYTPSDVYIVFPKDGIEESIIYYIYASKTSCLPERHKAEIIFSTHPHADENSGLIYLSTVITYYDEDADDVWIYQIRDDDRRRVLKELEGPMMDVVREKFLRHVHDGESDSPSKINLGTQSVEEIPIIPGSTVFMFTPFALQNDDYDYRMDPLSMFIDADVKIDGKILGKNSYYLNNTSGYLYLKNNMQPSNTIQVIKYMDPKDTEIARGPQDDPVSYLNSTMSYIDADPTYVHDKYKLPSDRVGEIDASKFVFGKLPINKIQPIDHYGLNRIREKAIFIPSITTRTKNQQDYYLVDKDLPMGFDTEVALIFDSTIIGRVISLPFGFFKVKSDDYTELEKINWNENNGKIIKVCDNLLLGDHGGENRFNEVYVLTDAGEMWYSYNQGISWEKLRTPQVNGIFINDFTVSTDKIEREVKNRKTWDYHKVFNIATNIGLFSANFLAAKGNFMGGSDLVETGGDISWGRDFNDVEISKLLEIITPRIVTSDAGSSMGYERTLYIAIKGGGFYLKSGYNKEVDQSIDVIDMLWIYDNNNILVSTENKVYVNRSAKHIEIITSEQTESYWEHPLSQSNEEFELVYDLSLLNKNINKLSQERSRRKYIVGLDNGVAISSIDKKENEQWNEIEWNIHGEDIIDGGGVVVFDDSFVFDIMEEEYSTTYYISTLLGVWTSIDDGETWNRPYLYWDGENPLFVSKNNSEVFPLEYTADVQMQKITFNNQQLTTDIIKAEKDFTTYYAVNGGWEQFDADLVIYINGDPTTRRCMVDNNSGVFKFASSLTPLDDITFSVIKHGAYITDVGENIHSEMTDASIIDKNISTKTAVDVNTDDIDIKVSSNNMFPDGAINIIIDSEKMLVYKYDEYTFRVINNTVKDFHEAGSIVYLVKTERQLGIEDYLSIATSGQTYVINSLLSSNLIRSQTSSMSEWSGVFDDSHNYDEQKYDRIEKGFFQEVINTENVDEMDDVSSTTTLWTGLDVIPGKAPSSPSVIFSMMNAGSNNFLTGTEKGLWKFDGNTWKQLSSMDGAGIIYYIKKDRRGYLIVGANNGLWISNNDGETWKKDDTFTQNQLSYSSGGIDWYSNKNYEAFGKNDGISFLIYNWDDGIPESFHSDYFDDVVGEKVYSIHKKIFQRIDEDSGKIKTYDSIWILSSNGAWVCYNGTRRFRDGSINPYSSLLNGREAPYPGVKVDDENIDDSHDYSKDNRYIYNGLDENGEPIYVKLRFYDMFQDTRPKSVPMIFLTNDGVRIARNWRWVDPTDENLFLQWEVTPLSTSDSTKRVVCNCYTNGIDNTIDDDDYENIWKKYKCFIGTSNGVYRSYNGCYNMESCQKIPGVSSIYCLEYVDNTVYAGTNNGCWISNNDGDDWEKLPQEIGNVKYVKDGELAQTFSPFNNTIEKVSLYLHEKN